ncbi:Cytochrome P450-33C9 [Aphelenchoides besseyi]|nr:Cytochrome P450-33C9 [Aphelenchoides besseyi]
MLLYIFLILLIGYLFHHFYYKRRNLPPGPTPIPLFGNLLEVIFDPPGEAPYRRWKEKYGPVYTYWMGSIPIVAVAEYNTMVETFQKDGETYSGRYAFKEFDALVRGGDYGVIFTEGDVWKEQRRYALQVLRDFGLGKNLMQERIFDELVSFFKEIDDNNAAGVEEHNIVGLFDVAIGSIIQTVLFGYRFHGEKRGEFFELKDKVQAHIKVLGHPLVLVAMPNPKLFLKIPFLGRYVRTAVETGNYLLDFFRVRIQEHEQTLNENEPASDFVHAFMLEWKKREQNGDSHHFSLYDLWIAGQETTSNTLAWGAAYLLLHYSDVQQKCHEELDSVIGSDRLINMSDKANLPYCNAVINEIQRIANLVPQNVWHKYNIRKYPKTDKDVVINGHHVPNGIAILPQISVVLSDPAVGFLICIFEFKHHLKVYPNPNRFDPTRFLDENGKLKRADQLVPFSIGKRQCLGESLARMELFLFTANILNRYTLRSGKTPPSLQRRLGATVNIIPFKCRIEKRTHN